MYFSTSSRKYEIVFKLDKYSNKFILNKKKTKLFRWSQYGWDREIRTPEMTGSEPVALPLGYIPTSKYYITSNTKEMQALF